MGRGENFFFGFAVVRRADGVDVCGVRGLRVVEFGEEVVGGFEVVGYCVSWSEDNCCVENREVDGTDVPKFM